jgi:hypothetical protein
MSIFSTPNRNRSVQRPAVQPPQAQPQIQQRQMPPQNNFMNRLVGNQQQAPQPQKTPPSFNSTALQGLQNRQQQAPMSPPQNALGIGLSGLGMMGGSRFGQPSPTPSAGMGNQMGNQNQMHDMMYRGSSPYQSQLPSFAESEAMRQANSFPLPPQATDVNNMIARKPMNPEMGMGQANPPPSSLAEQLNRMNYPQQQGMQTNTMGLPDPQSATGWQQDLYNRGALPQQTQPMAGPSPLWAQKPPSQMDQGQFPPYPSMTSPIGNMQQIQREWNPQIAQQAGMGGSGKGGQQQGRMGSSAGGKGGAGSGYQNRMGGQGKGG